MGAYLGPLHGELFIRRPWVLSLTGTYVAVAEETEKIVYRTLKMKILQILFFRLLATLLETRLHGVAMADLRQEDLMESMVPRWVVLNDFYLCSCSHLMQQESYL